MAEGSAVVASGLTSSGGKKNIEMSVMSNSACSGVKSAEMCTKKTGGDSCKGILGGGETLLFILMRAL